MRTVPLAETQLSILPLFHAECCVDQEWSSEPSHWAICSEVCPAAGAVVLICHGYWRPLPFGWSKTL